MGHRHRACSFGDHTTLNDPSRLTPMRTRRRSLTSRPYDDKKDVKPGQRGGGEGEEGGGGGVVGLGGGGGGGGSGGGWGGGEGRPELSVKVVLLGDYGVGKTRLLSTLHRAALSGTRGFSCAAYRPREFVELTTRRRWQSVRVKVSDTAGQERFRSLTSSYFRGAQGCFLVFNVTQKESFNGVLNWYSDLQHYGSAATDTLLLGVNTANQSIDAREVTSQRAFHLAEALGARYLEASTEDEEILLLGVEQFVDSAMRSLKIDLESSSSGTVTIYPSLGHEDRCRKMVCCASC